MRLLPFERGNNVDGSTGAVCITNPNNPTGSVLSASNISDFVDSLPAEVAAIIDEAYHDYVHDPAYQSAIDLVLQGRNVVVIRTFSKAYGLAGVRIGYAVGKQSLISAMAGWHLFATVSRFSLAAAQAALTDTQHIADTVSLNDRAEECCYESFSNMGLDYVPSETNFFMVDVGRSASGVYSQLSAGYQDNLHWDGKDKNGIPVANGSYFYRLSAGSFEGTRRMIWMR